MKILITAVFVAFISTFPSATATSHILLPPKENPLQDRLDSRKELEIELSVYKRIKLTPEQKRQLLKLDLELEQKRLLD
ncbi:hypothetical protein HGA34_04845 [Candidatus Falkowbacteria bacterium]|nr:hypothetical protein [Candidatus Falkowbacteria bacterium]